MVNDNWHVDEGKDEDDIVDEIYINIKELIKTEIS